MEQKTDFDFILKSLLAGGEYLLLVLMNEIR